MVTTKYAFVSLFTGAGGLDLGLEMAGWTCLYASDIDPVAVDTIRANKLNRTPAGTQFAFGSAHIEKADVRDLSGRGILAAVGAPRGSVLLLAGGPPCQSWSSAGHQLGFKDPRGRLWSDFVRIADELDVRWLLFENVRGLLTARGEDGVPGSALATIRSKLLDAGFQTTVSLLNAADYGVPQRRTRLFIIGYRTGDAPPFPKPSHSKWNDLASGQALPWVTLGECLRRIAPLSEAEIIRPSSKLALELDGVPPGSGVRSPGRAETTRPGGHWGYKQGAFVADLALAARTVTAGGQQDWVRDPEKGLRRLAPRECASIQTYPDNYVWRGKRSDHYRLIGNSVPPLLARAIGAELLLHVKATDDAGARRSGLHRRLSPLPAHLEAAIAYTMREEKVNGEARRNAPRRRKVRPLEGSC